MPVVRMPDGALVNMPDNPTAAQLESLRRLQPMSDADTTTHLSRLTSAEAALNAETAKAAPTSVLHKALTGLDLAGAGLSSAVTVPLSGLAGLEAQTLKNAGMNTDPARVKAAIADSGYHTHEGYGRDITDAVAAGISPATDLVAKGNNAVLSRLTPEWQGKVRDLEGLAGSTADVAGGLAGGGASVLKRSLAEPALSTTVAETAPDIARAAGLRVTPSTVSNLTGAGETPGVTRRLLETAAGSNAAHTDTVLHNRPVIRDIALQDVGLPAQTKVPSTVSGLEDTLKEAAKPYAATYQKVRNILGNGAVPMTGAPEEIATIGRGTDSLAQVPQKVQSLKEHYTAALSQPISGSNALDTMSDLRSQGYKAIASPDAETQAVGHAQLEIAKVIEKRLAATADRVDPGLTQEFANARTGFAKLHTIDAARVGNDIDPQAIRRIGERAGTNTGGLKLIEDMATHFEPDMQVRPPTPTTGQQIVRSAALGGGGATGLAVGAALGSVPGAIIGAALPWATSRAARSLLKVGTGVADRPQIRLGRALERYYKDRPARPVEPFSLEPTPGDFQPHQPPLQGLNDLDTSMAESTQNPRTVLDLKPPPGPRNIPLQREFNLEDPNDYIGGPRPTIEDIIKRLKGQ